MARAEAETTVSTGLLTAWDDLEDAVGVIVGIRGAPATAPASATLLRTYSHHGNPVLGPFDGDDHLALRAADPVGAAAARAEVREQLLDGFAAGLEIVDLARGAGDRLAPAHV